MHYIYKTHELFKDEKMQLTSLPNAQRPREKLIEKGAKALSDAELLAIFLRTGNECD